ncbi:MAG TPA: outer membrane protein assembly factor BamD [Verrucomicrobiae bacterium]|nr:outer membrane protein assembly factor BamD [Verrucomicrobiae bacterium]
MLRHTHKIWIVVLAATLLGGCFGKKKNAPVAGTSTEPDKVLYGKATDDIKHGRYTVGRLGLQTLINTYPDSEYLAKAKLAIGDSYYKEGGTAGLKQSIVEYKDFITFFPFLDEAPYAQLQVGMAHYRQMEKPDRDHAEAVQAEAELQTFLEKYPNSPLAPQAEQRLRETQEVLAEGNFRVARFYYIRGGYRAAGARLLDLTNRYPLYSQADQANWMLGQIYEKTEHNDIAARYYGRIVKDYPLSALAGDAKNKLTKFGVPVPPADPAAVARMQKDESSADRPGILGRSLNLVRTRPDVSTASHTGAPTMTPSGEMGDETLSFGTLPTATIGVGSASGSTATVETVTPGSSGSLPAPAASSSDPAPASSDSAPDAAQPASSSSPAPAADKSQESTSKKKKGIHKVIPF